MCMYYRTTVDLSNTVCVLIARRSQKVDHYEASFGLSRETKQAWRHMLLLLGRSYSQGIDLVPYSLRQNTALVYFEANMNDCMIARWVCIACVVQGVRIGGNILEYCYNKLVSTVSLNICIFINILIKILCHILLCL